MLVGFLHVVYRVPCGAVFGRAAIGCGIAGRAIERIVRAERVSPLEIDLVQGRAKVLALVLRGFVLPLGWKLRAESWAGVGWQQRRHALIQKSVLRHAHGQRAVVQVGRDVCQETGVCRRLLVEAVQAAVCIRGLGVVEERRGCLELVLGVGKEGALGDRRVVRFLVEGALEAGLVGYCARDAVDRGRGDEVLPVVVVVRARLVVEQRRAIVVVVRGRVVDEVFGKGVWGGRQSIQTAGECRAAGMGTKHTAKRRWVLVVHGGTREASGRSTREPRERLMRQSRQLEGLVEGEGSKGGEVSRGGRAGPREMGCLAHSTGRADGWAVAGLCD